jgi:hypothetical protein
MATDKNKVKFLKYKKKEFFFANFSFSFIILTSTTYFDRFGESKLRKLGSWFRKELEKV